MLNKQPSIEPIINVKLDLSILSNANKTVELIMITPINYYKGPNCRFSDRGIMF